MIRHLCIGRHSKHVVKPTPVSSLWCCCTPYLYILWLGTRPQTAAATQVHNSSVRLSASLVVYLLIKVMSLAGRWPLKFRKACNCSARWESTAVPLDPVAGSTSSLANMIGQCRNLS